jgi:hypothetical protein
VTVVDCGFGCGGCGCKRGRAFCYFEIQEGFICIAENSIGSETFVKIFEFRGGEDLRSFTEMSGNTGGLGWFVGESVGERVCRGSGA